MREFNHCKLANIETRVIRTLMSVYTVYQSVIYEEHKKMTQSAYNKVCLVSSFLLYIKQRFALAHSFRNFVTLYIAV